MIYDQNRFRNRTPSPLKNVHFLAKSSTVMCTSRFSVLGAVSDDDDDDNDDIMTRNNEPMTNADHFTGGYDNHYLNLNSVSFPLFGKRKETSDPLSYNSLAI